MSGYIKAGYLPRLSKLPRYIMNIQELMISFCSVLLLLLTTEALSLSHWAVFLEGGEEEAISLADKHGFQYKGQVGKLKHVYHFISDKDSSRSMIGHISDLKKETKVRHIKKQTVRIYERKGFTPPTDPLWGDQWPLYNTGQTNGPSGYDLNIQSAWVQGITGKGVTVGIIDDGLQHTHPDLSGNYDDNSSYDFVGQDPDPSPRNSFIYRDAHGTKCAGIIAMNKSNGICGTGVAYDAKIAGLRLITDQGSTDIQEAVALNYKYNNIDIYSNSWGPYDKGFTVEGPRILTRMALENGVNKGRDGKGSIYVWAAGNGGFRKDSCAADGYVNSIYTIAIGSVDDQGNPTYYDEQCSAKMAVTYSFSSNTSYITHVLSTTLGNRCTKSFTGTSAATPLAAGVIALALQANPALTWRDVQYLIVYTANAEPFLTKKHLPLWITNGAGLNVSSQFGFGAIDAEAMVIHARHWINVPTQIVQEIVPDIKSIYASKLSPVNIQWMVTSSTSNQDTVINPTNITYLEHVVVQLSLMLSAQDENVQYDYSDYYDALYDDVPRVDDVLYHAQARRGDISVSLTSPQGTTSILLPYRDRDFINTNGYFHWPFMSLHFWGENPIGNWMCTVSYRSTVGKVKVSNVKVMFYGTKTTPDSVKKIPSICPSSCVQTKHCFSVYCDSCKNFRDPQTLQCLNSCPNGTTVFSNYCIDPNSDFNFTAIPGQSTSTITTISPTATSSKVTITTTLKGGDKTGYSSSLLYYKQPSLYLVSTTADYTMSQSTSTPPSTNAFNIKDEDKLKPPHAGISGCSSMVQLSVTLLSLCSFTLSVIVFML